jgi:hypothetical protein
VFFEIFHKDDKLPSLLPGYVEGAGTQYEHRGEGRMGVYW